MLSSDIQICQEPTSIMGFVNLFTKNFENELLCNIFQHSTLDLGILTSSGLSVFQIKIIIHIFFNNLVSCIYQ